MAFGFDSVDKQVESSNQQSQVIQSILVIIIIIHFDQAITDSFNKHTHQQKNQSTG